MRKRTAILISGRGSNMVALIEAARDPAYPAEIALVVSNNPDAPGLARAREAGITTAAIDHRAFGKDRAGFEAALQSVLEAHGIELVCLAGFMRLLTAEFVSKWQGRMINIHPALLPDFKGLDTPRAPSRPARRPTAQRFISWCRKWTPARSSRKRPCRFAPTTHPRRWQRA